MTAILRSLILIVILFQAIPSKSQTDSETILDDLFYRMISAEDDFMRIQISDSVRSIIDSYAKSDSVFSHRFNIRNLGQITSPDSLLKIISWNIPLQNYNGKYFCYLIMKDKEGKPFVQFLTASYNPEPVGTGKIYTAQNWYGALYYDARLVRTGEDLQWVLLGLDLGNPLITRKIIDVLNFDNDSVSFGKKWFSRSGEMSHRVVFQYASTGVMTLRFNSDTSIVFDHLVPVSSGPDNTLLYGADYSYDAYSYKDGTWNFSLNVDIRNKE